MEYDVVLKHHAGKKMIVADALSQRADWSKGVENDNEDVTALPEELFIKALDTELWDAVVLAQMTNEAALEALRRLSDPSDPPRQMVYRGRPKQTWLSILRQSPLYPERSRLAMTDRCGSSDSLVAGHPGALATTRSVKFSYWWPGLQSFVRNYVASCAVCQQFKVSTHPIKPSLFLIASSSAHLLAKLGLTS